VPLRCLRRGGRGQGGGDEEVGGRSWFGGGDEVGSGCGAGGYYAGEGMQDGAMLFAAIAFEGEEVDWFTCHAFGIRTATAEDFLNTCWTAAAVTGADQAAGAEWLTSMLAMETDESSQILHDSETICPAELLATSLSSTETYLNMQFSVTPAEPTTPP
jgi:hypothetical protein